MQIFKTGDKMNLIEQAELMARVIVDSFENYWDNLLNIDKILIGFFILIIISVLIKLLFLR